MGKDKGLVSDRGMDFQSWTGKLGIENYINDVDTYHQKIIDKNNATEKEDRHYIFKCAVSGYKKHGSHEQTDNVRQ